MGGTGPAEESIKETEPMRRNKGGMLSVFMKIFMFFAPPAVILGVGLLRQLSFGGLIWSTILAAMGSGCLLFSLEQEKLAGRLEFHNEDHFGRFFLWFLFGLVVSACCVLLPVSAWPYPVLAVIFTLFGNALIGILSNSLLLFVSVTLTGGDFTVFFLYFICGTVSAMVFRKLDEDFKIMAPILISEIILGVALAANALLSVTGTFSLEALIIPGMNLIITTIFFLLFMKYFSVAVIFRYKEHYQEITDQEYCLIVELKKKSKEEYYHAIHSAYFCDKIANAIGCDRRLAKALGYYHRLWVFWPDATESDYIQRMKEHKFPPVLQELLLELNHKNKKIVHKEAAVVYFTDAVIGTIMNLFHKNPGVNPDFAQLLNTVFKVKTDNGVMNHSELSIAQYTRMKEIFLEDKLYYDFLR